MYPQYSLCTMAAGSYYLMNHNYLFNTFQVNASVNTV